MRQSGRTVGTWASSCHDFCKGRITQWNGEEQRDETRHLNMLSVLGGNQGSFFYHDRPFFKWQKWFRPPDPLAHCERHDMIMMDVIITALLLGNLLLQCYSLVSGPTFPSYAGEWTTSTFTIIQGVTFIHTIHVYNHNCDHSQNLDSARQFSTIWLLTSAKSALYTRTRLILINRPNKSHRHKTCWKLTL